MTIFWLLKYLVLSSDPLLVFGALVEDDNSPISTAHQPVFLFPRKKPHKWIFYPSSSSDFFCQTSNLEQANIQNKRAKVAKMMTKNIPTCICVCILTKYTFVFSRTDIHDDEYSFSFKDEVYTFNVLQLRKS